MTLSQRYIYFPNPHPKSDIDLLEPHRTMWSDDMGNIEDVIAEAEARKREEKKKREKVEKRESKKHRKQDTEDEHKEKGKDNAKPKGKQKLMFGIVLLALIVGGGVVAAPHLTQNLPINNPKQPAGDTAEGGTAGSRRDIFYRSGRKAVNSGRCYYGRRSTGSCYQYGNLQSDHPARN